VFLAQLQPVTTVRISCMPAGCTCSSLKKFLDDSGLSGTYDFCYLLADDSRQGDNADSPSAIVNFVNPSFVYMCQEVLSQCPDKGIVSVAPFQGLAANLQSLGLCRGFWGYEDRQQMQANLLTPPNEWTGSMAQAWNPTRSAADLGRDELGSFDTLAADSSVQEPSSRFWKRFWKTKMCAAFTRWGDCSAGHACKFAHSSAELQGDSEFTKMRICRRFLRGQCRGSCRFAHGQEELRGLSRFYKTAPCRWWEKGRCQAGSACRFAHGVEELRELPGPQSRKAPQPLPPGLISGQPPVAPGCLVQSGNVVVEPDSTPDIASAALASPNAERNHAGNSQLVESVGPTYVMKERWTFMEVAFVDESDPAMPPLRPSRSEGDLSTLAKAEAAE